MKEEGQIKQEFNGTTVAATESIVQFLANATGLNIITPVSFMFAVAEGNDPAPADVVTFERQLRLGTNPCDASSTMFRQ